MLTFENNRISGFGSFEHKDSFNFYKCKWDKEAKNWYVPPETDIKMISKLVNKINDESTQKTNEKWARACAICDVQFAKKGTEDYDKVMTKFKELV
jgi:hypoxanthine phosphoribosyltransferase